MPKLLYNLMGRYPGCKYARGKNIINHRPAGVNHYVEPFLGLAGVYRKLRELGTPLKSYTLSDKSPYPVLWLQAIQGTYTDFGCPIKRMRFDQERFQDEEAKKFQLEAYFHRLKVEFAEYHNPYAWWFLNMYAKVHLCGHHRKNIATFERKYLGTGISKSNIPAFEMLRQTMGDTILIHRDIFETIEDLKQTAGPDTWVFIDPPYPQDRKSFTMYDWELTDEEHLRLCEILKDVPFRFSMTMPGNSSLVNLEYVLEYVLEMEKSFNKLELRCTHVNDRSNAATPKRREWLITNYVN